MTDYVADSYALVAFLEGNERYVRIFGRKDVVTTSLNILEVYSTLLRRIPQAEARELAKGFLTIVVPVPPDAAFSAGDFRQSMREKKRDCSYVDAWGYAAASALHVPFLTGDSAFRQIENVEFVR